jgi:hypothetical protein
MATVAAVSPGGRRDVAQTGGLRRVTAERGVDPGGGHPLPHVAGNLADARE